MSKKDSSFRNMVMTLFIVTLVASTALGFVYELTKDPINRVRQVKKINAIREVLPDFNNDPYADVYKIPVENDTMYFYPAKKNDKLIGTAVQTFTNKGFSGNIKLMVGFLPDGTINDITVIEHKETPGLGDKIEKRKSDFSLQFQGKDPEKFHLRVEKDGGDVDAITASTISSRAFCDAILRAYKTYMEKDKK